MPLKSNRFIVALKLHSFLPLFNLIDMEPYNDKVTHYKSCPYLVNEIKQFFYSELGMWAEINVST